MIARRPLPILVNLTCAIVLLGGCASTTDHREELGHQAAPVPQPLAPDHAAEARAQEIAQDVAAKSQRSEKAEGKQDLVKDHVTVKTEDGKPVVEQVGEASWYGKFHQGKKTANGQRFDPNKLTAAHPSLPLGSEAKVTNLDTGKSVKVTINDRGPYVKGRDIDLSKAAAQQLGVTKDGAAAVRIDAVVAPVPERAAQPE